MKRQASFPINIRVSFPGIVRFFYSQTEAWMTVYKNFLQPKLPSLITHLCLKTRMATTTAMMMRTRTATAADKPITVASFISLAFWFGAAKVVPVVDGGHKSAEIKLKSVIINSQYAINGTGPHVSVVKSPDS